LRNHKRNELQYGPADVQGHYDDLHVRLFHSFRQEAELLNGFQGHGSSKSQGEITPINILDLSGLKQTKVTTIEPPVKHWQPLIDKIVLQFAAGPTGWYSNLWYGVNGGPAVWTASTQASALGALVAAAQQNC
jgi:hypothetical protein